MLQRLRQIEEDFPRLRDEWDMVCASKQVNPKDALVPHNCYKTKGCQVLIEKMSNKLMPDLGRSHLLLKALGSSVSVH